MLLALIFGQTAPSFELDVGLKEVVGGVIGTGGLAAVGGAAWMARNFMEARRVKKESDDKSALTLAEIADKTETREATNWKQAYSDSLAMLTSRLSTVEASFSETSSKLLESEKAKAVAVAAVTSLQEQIEALRKQNATQQGLIDNLQRNQVAARIFKSPEE